MMEKNNRSGNLLLKGAVIFNPVLIQLAGLCIVAAASTDVVTSLMFSVVFMLDTVVCCVLASLLFKKIPRWVRVALYLIIGSACVFPFAYFAEKTGISMNARMQMYLPMVGINSVTSVHCEQFAVKHKVGDSVQDAFAVSIGFGSVMLILGIIRELLGSGSFAGLDLGFPVKLSGLLMPFGAFVILGYLAMILKWYINKYRPEFNEQTALHIKQTRVSLRKGEIDESAPEETEEDSGISEMEFLFGNEPEEFEIFTEFWMPEEITAKDVESDMRSLSEEHEQYNKDTDRRIDELFRDMETTISFEDLDAEVYAPKDEEPVTESDFDEAFEDEEENGEEGDKE